MTVSTGRSPSRFRRVVIIVENLSVPFDRRVWNEATTLQRAGYEVSVICPKGKGAEASYEEIDGVRIYRHPFPWEAAGSLSYILEYSTALIFEVWLTWRIFLSRGFDIIHACNPPDLIFLVAAPFKYLLGKRFIFDHHDLNPELYIAKFNRRDLFYRALQFLEKRSFRMADIVIATNESYKAIAIERGRVLPEKVFVVRSGPNLDRVRIVPRNEQLKCGRTYLVGYVGVIGSQEGIDLLLASVRHIVRVQKRQDVHFGIVGGGPALQAMKRLAVEMGVAEYVTFTGRVTDDELFAMLNTSDVCVNPDLPNDMNDKSTMNKIMEYMALSKPIVQFDLTEGRFSARDASLYARKNDIADFAHKVLELLDDPERRRQMGELGRVRVVNELAWTHEAPKLLDAYAALEQRVS